MFFLLLSAAYGPERQTPEKQLRDNRRGFVLPCEGSGGSGRAERFDTAYRTE